MKPICIENLSKVYRGKRWKKVQALEEVSFAVEPGEIFGFLGPNGAGKSTTIKILMGLISPSGGRALLCDKPSTDLQSRQKVGYLPENPALYEFLSGREYLEFVAGVFRMDRSKIKSASEAVLDRLDLARAASRPIRSYSKGMVQRLGLAQALIHNPDIYVLDEPMSGLDPQGRALVKEIIADLGKQGKTVFFSTHITADVERICDRLAVIARGRLQAMASVDEILKTGLEGYRVIVRIGELPDLSSFGTSVNTKDGVADCRVNADDLPEFIALIRLHGGTIELVEPVRQDLEQYFLNVVNRSEA